MAARKGSTRAYRKLDGIIAVSCISRKREVKEQKAWVEQRGSWASVNLNNGILEAKERARLFDILLCSVTLYEFYY